MKEDYRKAEIHKTSDYFEIFVVFKAPLHLYTANNAEAIPINSP